jgi:hypothetical protein
VPSASRRGGYNSASRRVSATASTGLPGSTACSICGESTPTIGAPKHATHGARGSQERGPKRTVFARYTASELAVRTRSGRNCDPVCTVTASDLLARPGQAGWTGLPGLSNFDVPAIELHQHRQSVGARQIPRRPGNDRTHTFHRSGPPNFCCRPQYRGSAAVSPPPRVVSALPLRSLRP